jgi:aminoglycoside/choline kinase family phosphotransferase
VDRRQALWQWIETELGAALTELEPASADASFRRYFRARCGDRTWVAMDAPPAREDCRPFIRVAKLLADAGVHVPHVIAGDLERGFLLLSDLGTTSYLSALNDATADSLFDDAIDALLRWQLASRPDVLPPYDRALLTRELELFPDWYVSRHLRCAVSSRWRQTLDEVFALILENNLAQPAVYVHRDYMPRNLMLCKPNPGVLDFQDAVYGPISYDVASLFRDAFVSWEDERVRDWAARYWQKAQRAGLPFRPDFAGFYRDFEWMGVQRHLKVLGIFARLCYRDGKSAYLGDTPRFVAYVRATASRYRELAPLAALFDELERTSAAGGDSRP